MKFFVTVFFVLGQLCLISQSLTDHNPAVENAFLTIDEDAQEGVVSFVFAPYLSNYEIEGNPDMIPVKMTVCLLNTLPINGSGSLNQTALNHFDWLYDVTSNCFLATQKKNFYVDENIDISILTSATDNAFCDAEGIMGFNVNVQPAPCMNGVNVIEDDSVSDYKCMTQSTTLTTDQRELQFSAFPNPVKDILYFVFDDNKQKVDIDMIGNDGLTVKSFQFENLNNGQIELSDLTPSTYVLKINANGKIGYKKILVVK